MSNEAPVETAKDESKPKQYLLMADELHMAVLGKIIPGLLFVQVEGMGMQNNPNYMLLVNPIAQPQASSPIETLKPEEPKAE